MKGFDARRATGFTRWLLRQRQREDSVGLLARTARETADWPHRGVFSSDFVAHIERTKPRGVTQRMVRAAWEEYARQFASRPLEIEVDWGSLSQTRDRPDAGWVNDEGLANLPAAPHLQRLLNETRAGDRGAARKLLLEAKRRADVDALRLVRNFACRESDWSLLCEVLACGSEEILRDTFTRARLLEDRYVMDRAIELGSPSFLRELYADARLLESTDSCHIALRDVKALIPAHWQSFLPDEFLHGVNVTAPDARFCEELPVLPE